MFVVAGLLEFTMLLVTSVCLYLLVSLIFMFRFVICLRVFCFACFVGFAVLWLLRG